MPRHTMQSVFFLNTDITGKVTQPRKYTESSKSIVGSPFSQKHFHPNPCLTEVSLLKVKLALNIFAVKFQLIY